MEGHSKPDKLLKHLGIAFALALVFYFGTYLTIERTRGRKGPWEVTFHTNSAGQASLRIDQPRLGITNMQVVFNSESIPQSLALTNAGPLKITFSAARQVPFDVPFGQCVFLDTTFLPGTVTLRLFGHEVELLPRVLRLDGRVQRWRSGEMLVLQAISTNAVAK